MKKIMFEDYETQRTKIRRFVKNIREIVSYAIRSL